MTSSLPLPARFASFVFVGGVCLLANTAVLWALTAGLGIHYLLSTVIAFCTVTPLGFALNKVMTFRTRRESQLLYPPVDVSAVPLQERKEDFYLTVSRLEP